MFYGERLKQRRERIGYTQEFLGGILNISNDAYSKYEREYQIIPINHLITLCDYLDISLDYVFGFNDNMNYSDKKVDKEDNIVGIRLKEIRLENNLTQVKLAGILNTTQSVIADYERGRYLIATPFLYQICKKYKVSADYLLGKVDSPKYLKKNIE